MNNPFKFVRILPITIILLVIVGAGVFYHIKNVERNQNMQHRGFNNLANYEKILSLRVKGTYEQILSDTTNSTEKTLPKEILREYNTLMDDGTDRFFSKAYLFLSRHKDELELDFGDLLKRINELDSKCHYELFYYSYPDLKKQVSKGKSNCYSTINELLNLMEDLGKAVPNPPGGFSSSVVFENSRMDVKEMDAREDEGQIILKTMMLFSHGEPEIHYVLNSNAENHDKRSWRTYKSSLKDFTKGIFNLAFFDNVFLFDDEHIYLNSHQTTHIHRPDSALIRIVQSGYNTGISDYEFAGESHYLFVMPFTALDQELFIGGLISKSKFSKLVKVIDPAILTLLLIFLITIIIFFPLWKLMFMNEYDEMDRSDAYWVGLSIIAGVFFLVTISLSTYTHFYYNKSRYEANVETLSMKLETELTNLFSRSQSHLEALNKRLVQFNPAQDSSFLENKKVINRPELFDEKSMRENYLKHFYEGIFISGEGYVKYLNTQDTTISTNFRLNKRSYFTNAKERNDQHFHIDDQGNKYYFQSVYSYPTDKNEFAISTPAVQNSQGISVLAVTHNLLTFQESVFTPGYSFCMINRQGEVLLHSDKRKILRENFLFECDKNKYLVDAIHNSRKNYKTINYNGKQYYSYITPLQGTPFFLVTLYDLRFEQMINTRVNLYMVTFLIFNLLLICLLILITFFIFNRKHGYFDIKFLHSWLFYHPTNRNKYLFLCCVYAILIPFYLWVLFDSNNLLTAICISAFLIVGTNAINFTILNGISWRDLTRHSEQNHYLNAILGKRRMVAYYVVYFLLSILIFYTYIYDVSRSGIRLLGILQYLLAFVIIILSILVYLFRLKILPGLKKVSSRVVSLSRHLQLDTPHLYLLFLLFWVGIICVLPALHYNKALFNKEKSLWQMYEAKGAIEQFQQKSRHIYSHYKNTYRLSDRESMSHILKDIKYDPEDKLAQAAHSDFIEQFLPENTIAFSFNMTDQSPEILEPESVAFINSIYSKLRYRLPGFDSTNYTLLNFNYDELNTDTECDTFTMHYQVGFNKPFHKLAAKIDIFDNRRFLFITGKSNFFPENMSPFGYIIFFIALFTFIFLLWRALRFIVKNIAFFRFNEITAPVLKDDKIHRHWTSGMPQVKYSPIYVFTYTGKRKDSEITIHEVIKKVRQRNSSTVIKCTNEGEISFTEEKLTISGYKWISKKVRHLLITNLDYNITNPQVFKERVKILEWLYQHPSIEVTISSSFGFSKFKEIFEELIEAYRHDKEEVKELKRTWEKWVFLLRKYKRTILPMAFDKFVAINSEQAEDEDANDNQLRDNYEYEHYKMSFFYANIWKGLTQKERILMLDIAKDGVINIKNTGAINTLLQKRLLTVRDENQQGNIRENPIVKISRNSLTSYVEKLHLEGETKELDNWITKKGNWSNTKYLLIFVIVGLIVFLGYIEEAFFDRFVAILGAIAAVVPLLFKVGQSLFFKRGEGG